MSLGLRLHFYCVHVEETMGMADRAWHSLHPLPDKVSTESLELVGRLPITVNTFLQPDFTQ